MYDSIHVMSGKDKTKGKRIDQWSLVPGGGGEVNAKGI